MAEAACMVNASIKYVCMQIKHEITPMPKKERAKHGNTPLHMVLCCPSINEKTDRHGDTKENERRQTKLGLHLAIVACGEELENAIRTGASQYETDKHANTAGNIAESHIGAGEVVVFLKDEGEGCEQQVQDPVHNSDVEAGQEDDGREA